MSPLFVPCMLIVVALASAGTGKPYCPINSKLKQCGGLCESTCWRQEKILCRPKDPDSCKEECECVDGFVRNEANNECVRPSECPTTTMTKETTTKETTTEETTTEETTTESWCPANENWHICGRMCEPTCRNKNPQSIFCPGILCNRFTEGCRCKRGYYRNGKRCVLSKDCPKIGNMCGDNEEFGSCGRRCERNCDEPHKANCNPTLCLTRDCRCKDGYSRDKDDKCIRNKDCPKERESREVFSCWANSCSER